MKAKYLFLFLCIEIILGSMIFVSCGSEDDVMPEKTGDSYGKLDGNLIATGDVNQISYTSAVLLGIVDFSKIGANYVYGIVYMEESDESNFDYTTELTYANVSSGYRPQVSNSTAEGKFEKQIVGLKPATKYYYRSWISVGQNYNYSSVKSFSTQDPSGEISMTTTEATDITALGATMNGTLSIGKLQEIVEEQKQGFILSPSLKSAETLTHEYYHKWEKNHLETDEEIAAPKDVLTDENLDNIIKKSITGLIPGTTYYFRSFFKWNEKYFYSKDVKSFTTEGSDLTVITKEATDVSIISATLNGTIPYSKVGSESVTAGFIYSDDYTLPSELTIDNKGDGINYEMVNVSEDNYSFKLTSLRPNTTYFYRAYMVLKVNGEDPLYIYDQSAKQFTTGDLKVITIEASGLEGTTACMNGNMPFNDISNLFYTAGFIYSNNYNSTTDLNLDNAASKAEVLEKHSSFKTDNYSINVENLEEFSKYYYRAYVQIKLPHSEDIITFYAVNVESFTTEGKTYEYVDLALPSGLKWATCNVGASSPEEYGGYFAWGETSEKNEYSEGTYFGPGYTITTDIAGTEYDVAHVKWGGSWRMPRMNELRELVNNCTWQWTKVNGVAGQKLTGPNGNSIFLPAAGWSADTSFGEYSAGYFGCYWSSTPENTTDSYKAYYLFFDSGSSNWNDHIGRPFIGSSVRPVSE